LTIARAKDRCTRNKVFDGGREARLYISVY
jgi:hypothetical protein